MEIVVYRPSQANVKQILKTASDHEDPALTNHIIKEFVVGDITSDDMAKGISGMAVQNYKINNKAESDKSMLLEDKEHLIQVAHTHNKDYENEVEKNRILRHGNATLKRELDKYNEMIRLGQLIEPIVGHANHIVIILVVVYILLLLSMLPKNKWTRITSGSILILISLGLLLYLRYRYIWNIDNVTMDPSNQLMMKPI